MLPQPCRGEDGDHRTAGVKVTERHRDDNIEQALDPGLGVAAAQ
jgi:hypothetical protein